MALTSINANRLKQEAGVALTGRKRTRGEVFSFSLSWSPDEEKPDKAHMKHCADETLKVLKLQDHQSVLVAHNDTDHPHLHVIVNLVSQNDGRMADPDWGSRLKLSEWALKYEKERGYVLCPTREENSQKREQGEKVRYKEQIHNRKEEIQNIYRNSDSGLAFSAALEEQGYTLAQGNRRKFVLVDEQGKIHSLSRQIKGFWGREENKTWRSDMAAKLQDWVDAQDSSKTQTAQEISKQKAKAWEENQHFDRDKYHAEQEDELFKTAIKADKEKRQAERKENERQKDIERQKVRHENARKERKPYSIHAPENGMSNEFNAEVEDKKQQEKKFEKSKLRTTKLEREEDNKKRKELREKLNLERQKERHETARKAREPYSIHTPENGVNEEFNAEVQDEGAANDNKKIDDFIKQQRIEKQKEAQSQTDERGLTVEDRLEAYRERMKKATVL